MKILVLDIETTGFSSDTDAIVEIGMVLVDTKTNEMEIVFDEIVKEPKFNPIKHKNAWVFKNSTLTPEIIEKGNSLDSYKQTIQKLFDKYPMTAFNKSFDIRFMTAVGFKMNDIKCLMKSSANVVKETRKDGKFKAKVSVESVYNKFFRKNTDNVYIEKHRAGQDAIDEAEILLHLVKLKKENVTEIDKTEAKNQTTPKKRKVFDLKSKFDFGKYNGTRVMTIAKNDPQYIRWCLKSIPTFKLTNDMTDYLNNPKIF